MQEVDVSLDSTKKVKSVQELRSMFEQNIKKPVRASDEVIQAIANKEKKAT